MDALDTKKALAIAEEIKAIEKLMEETLKVFIDNERRLKELVAFCYDDYLSGKQYVSKSTFDYMVKAYGEKFAQLTTIVERLGKMDLLKSEQLEQFRANLDAFMVAENIDKVVIKTKFD